jgi:ubiquinone biosynthesis protein UbiJ
MGFIDEMIQGLSKEVENIKARSQIMLRIYHLDQEIKDLQQQKTDQLASIGSVIYDKYQQQIMPSEEPLRQKCTEIQAIEKDIADLQTQLGRLKPKESK